MRRRTLAALAVGVVLTIACVAVLVAGLTGVLTVVITHGDSMEPTYHAGDVVVVAQTDTYAVGDIAAYHSGLLNQLVLHRIVDTGSDGTFVLSGDNNPWLDPERPTAGELVGTAWLHLPKVGIPARWLAAHAPLPAVGVFALVAATGSTTATTRRKRTVTEHERPINAGRATSSHHVVAGLLAGLLAFGALAAVAWSRPTTTAAPVDFAHHGEFTYAATAATGVVYDSPQVRTGQPLFLALIDDVRVGFSYGFTTEEPAEIGGTIGLRATVDNATGWSRTLQLAAPQPFDGNQADVAGDLDLGTIRSLVAEIAVATGESGPTTITLHPEVVVNGDVAGHPLADERFAPSLAYQLTDTQLRAVAGTDDDAPFRTSEPGELQVPDRQAAVLSGAGRTIEVAAARWVSLTIVVACAAGLLGVMAASRRTAKLSEIDRVKRRWPDLIVSADVRTMLPLPAVALDDMAGLVALAQRSGRLILHDRAADAFLLDLDGTHYRYHPAAAADSGGRPDESTEAGEPVGFRRRLDGDDGISLVEMLVAVVILGVVMSASASFFTTALLSLHTAESRTKATALANEELENLRALDWTEVGFYDDDFAAPAPADTVILAAQRPAQSRAPLPEETLDRGGVVFTVRRSATWIANAQTASAQDYKDMSVSVDWSDRGRPRSITVDSPRSPTPDEQPGSDFSLSLLEVAPNFLYINADGTLDAAVNDRMDLTALTSAEADFVVGSYTQRGAISETAVSLGSSDHLNWAAAVTAAHGHTFPNGDVLFTFVATRALPYEQEVLGSTLVRFLQPVTITAAALSPSSVCLSDSLLASPAIDVTIDIDGLVEEDTVTVAWDGGQVTAAQVAATSSGSSLTAQIPAGAFGAGTHTVTLTGQRLSDAETATTIRDVVVHADCGA